MERNEQLKRSAGLEMRELTIPGLIYISLVTMTHPGMGLSFPIWDRGRHRGLMPWVRM